MGYFFVFLFVGLAFYAYKHWQYSKEAYYQITKIPYLFVKHDKGRHGEYLIYKNLQHFEKTGGKFLFNLYIPKTDDQKIEIDVVLICSKGLFVFESKNFGGWIFGNEAHQNWTQVFPLGHRRSRKESFYNSIKQNAGHIRYLKKSVGENIPTHSIVVFSDRCILKDVTLYSRDVVVTYYSAVTSAVTKIYCQTQPDLLTEKEIDNIYNKLHPYTQISRQEEKSHADRVNEIFKNRKN